MAVPFLQMSWNTSTPSILKIVIDVRSVGRPVYLMCSWVSGKESASNVGNIRYVDSIPGSGIFPGGLGYPLSSLAWGISPTDRGAWWATVHEVTTEAMQHAPP